MCAFCKISNFTKISQSCGFRSLTSQNGFSALHTLLQSLTLLNRISLDLDVVSFNHSQLAPLRGLITHWLERVMLSHYLYHSSAPNPMQNLIKSIGPAYKVSNLNVTTGPMCCDLGVCDRFNSKKCNMLKYVNKQL